MPLPAIPNHVAGFMVMDQTTWGTAGTLTASTDGAFPYIGDGLPPAPFASAYLYDGGRGRSVKSLLNLPMVGPVGRNAETTFPCFFKGAGSTYSSSSVVLPNEVRMLRFCGFDETFNTDQWDYTLTAAGMGFKFATYGYYAQGKSFLLRDVVMDWSYSIDGVGIPVHTFALKGVQTATPATLTLPTITYPLESINPPVAKAATMTIGDWVAPVTSKGAFNLGRQFGAPRGRVTETDGHMGVIPTGFQPTMTFTVEQTALVGSPYHSASGLDPDKLREAATAITVSQAIGTSPNKWSVTMTNAQCSNVTPANDDASGMWDVEYKPSSSSVITVTFD